MAEKLKEAVLYEQAEDKKVRCNLCNHRCKISEGNRGLCGVRQNIDGKLYSLNYHKLCAANADPIEKKPLFHFQPGSRAFSISAPGCNFQCDFCQNWQISQILDNKIEGQAVEPARLVDLAIGEKCRSMAYTYTEPTVFMELAADCAIIAKQRGLANVFVSNGYMTKNAIDFAKDWLDGINIDLKSFSEGYYKRLCKAKVSPVFQTIDYVANHTNIWMEITTLIVPGENDSEKELRQIAEFIFNTCGADVPWHVSRFYPQYKYTDASATPYSTLQMAYDIAKQVGLRYVYIGNLRTQKGENTYCPKCGSLLVEREGYYITQNRIKNSICLDCGEKIAGFKLNGEK
ncbi:MAG: AmmeMemoRadiSam system radical SAM enzyme [Planctomycetaceae bacterium]|nr:AmmeMemoRadiSam system radical SAM enzyme [Planctomycetaceae bacterium]